MKYEASRDLPEFARESRSLSPSVLAQMVLDKRNEKTTPESVTMWFKRHPDIYESLKLEITDMLPTAAAPVDDQTFGNGFFDNLRTVKEWVMFMKTRRRRNKALKPEYVQEQVRELRYVCKMFHKHPDRLTYRDAQEIFMALEADKTATHWEGGGKVAGRDTYMYRRALKDFLKSKGAKDWEKIGVGKPSGFAHFKTLFVEKPIVLEMLAHIKTIDFRVYVCDKVMYHNGLRLNAILKAKIEGFTPNGEWDYLKVLEKFREEKTFMIVKEVGALLKQVIGDRKEGLIFEGLTEEDISKVNREALKKYVPDQEPQIEMPNHFFRHMCAQHLLRATGWNSKAVADIMQTTEQSLNESYGGAPKQQHEVWCKQFLPLLGQ